MSFCEMDDISMMDWQSTPPAAEINSYYNLALLERRRSRDEFEIPNMPGGWVDDDYTERQFHVKDVVQFQHLAKPSVITCAKKAVGQAKRRCIRVAASVSQAPNHLLTIAHNTHTHIASAFHAVHATTGPTVNQIVRRVRQIQSVRRRRPVTPRPSAQGLPHPTRRVQISPASLSKSTHSSPTGGPHKTTNSPPTSFYATRSPKTPLEVTPSMGKRPMGINSPRKWAANAEFDLSCDAPLPAHWLDQSQEVKFIDLNKRPEAPQTPLSPRSAAEYQLMAEMAQIASSSSEGPKTAFHIDHELPATPQNNPQPYPSYMQAGDSNISSHAPETPQDSTEFSSNVPFSPPDDSENTIHIRVDIPEDSTEFSSYVPFSPPDDSENNTQHVSTPEDSTGFSSYVPFSPPDDSENNTQHVSPPEDSTGFSSYVPFSPPDDSENSTHIHVSTPGYSTGFSSYVPFSPPEDSEINSHVFVDAPDDGRDLSSGFPIDSHDGEVLSSNTTVDANDDCKELSNSPINNHDGEVLSSNTIVDANDDGKDLSNSPINNHDDGQESEHGVTPDWYEEPAVSPFTKSPDTRTRRVTRLSIRLETEEQQRKEERRQLNLEKSKISALSEEWENKVCEAVRAGSPPNYTAADFARVVPLRPGGFTDSWLNDESVNGYLKIVTKFHNVNHPSVIPKSHAFPSFMLNQIAEKGYKGVERWAKRAKIGGSSLLQTHTIFIPVNSGSHWTLMVVYPGARTAHYYDSMGQNRRDNGKKWFDLVKIWLRGELGEEYKEREWAFFDKESPQQNNSSDCGVFAATTAKMLILGVDVLSYGPNDIPTQRKRMVAELVNGDFL